MNIWEYQRTIIQRLLQWSLFSLITGVLMLFGSGFWRAVGRQFIAWALVNMGIAYVGRRMGEERLTALPDPHDSQTVREETNSLRRLLEVNALLDVLYMAGGRILIRRGERGTGVGILVQGAFLFIFDLIHANNVPKEDA